MGINYSNELEETGRKTLIERVLQHTFLLNKDTIFVLLGLDVLNSFYMSSNSIQTEVFSEYLMKIFFRI